MKADKRGAAISAYSVHPGFINTPLSRHMSGGGGLAKLWSGLTAVPGLGGALGSKTVPQGAATTVFACVSPQLEGRSGEYLADCQVRWMGAGAGVCVWVGGGGGRGPRRMHRMYPMRHDALHCLPPHCRLAPRCRVSGAAPSARRPKWLGTQGWRRRCGRRPSSWWPRGWRVIEYQLKH